MRRLRITIENKSYDVTVEDLTEPGLYPPPPVAAVPPPAAAAAPPAATSTQPQLPIDEGSVTSPMAGVIKSVLVKIGESVKQGQALVVLEAMKMENQITAPIAGTVKSINVDEGQNVRDGHVLLVLE